jgi:hypothetical protein
MPDHHMCLSVACHNCGRSTFTSVMSVKRQQVTDTHKEQSRHACRFPGSSRGRGQAPCVLQAWPHPHYAPPQSRALLTSLFFRLPEHLSQHATQSLTVTRACQLCAGSYASGPHMRRSTRLSPTRNSPGVHLVVKNAPLLLPGIIYAAPSSKLLPACYALAVRCLRSHLMCAHDSGCARD